MPYTDPLGNVHKALGNTASVPGYAGQVELDARKRLAEIEAGLPGIEFNANGKWGGSDAQRAPWKQRLRELTAERDNIKTSLKSIVSQIQSGNIGEEQSDLVQSALQGDRLAKQALSELSKSNISAAKTKQELSNLRSQFETQQFGKPGATLEEALSASGGEIGQLGEALRKQQSDVFQRELKPLIDQRLAAQGLFDSGAKVELQAKALGSLEQSRQANLLQAALGARENIRNLTREDLLGDISSRQSALSEVSGLQRASITMAFQRELEAERASLARELSQQRGGRGGLLGGLSGAIGGGALGFAIGGPVGAAVGSVGGGLLGGLGPSGQGQSLSTGGLGLFDLFNSLGGRDSFRLPRKPAKSTFSPSGVRTPNPEPYPFEYG